MTIAREEIFGPVLSIIAYQDEEDARAHRQYDTVYGLAGAVWSRDDARAQRVARRIRAGQVDVNGGAFNMNAPFGGFKQSGTAARPASTASRNFSSTSRCSSRDEGSRSPEPEGPRRPGDRGSRGLGLQMAEALGEMGARLAITARQKRRA